MNAKSLVEKIEKAQVAYYNGSSIISDDEYDALIYDLQKLDPKHPLLSKVGADPNSAWVKEKHHFPLGSLNKVNVPSEMNDFFNNNLKKHSVVVTDKLDGLSIGCQYESGVLKKAILRGNGSEGENIFSNVIKMKGCVRKINTSFTGTVRGEIVLLKSDHKKHFLDYANPRNAASGICRRFDGKGVEHLTLMFYDVLGADFSTEMEKFNFLVKNGFGTPKFYLCKNADDVVATWKKYQDSVRASLDYEIDGLVIACNDIAFQESLGENNMRPKGKIAFKFANQMIKTTVRRITWEVGQTGRITPLCWFDPVDLLGSRIEKASVYNLAYVKKLGIDAGSEVLVCKANEVIPRVEKCIRSTGTAKPPTKCPECDSKIEVDGEYLLCVNFECRAQVVGRLSIWIAQHNILEWGDAVLEKLIDHDKLNVKTVADLYTLTVKDLAALDRMGDKSAQNLYDSLWANSEVTLDNFLGGLNIPMIGASMIRMVMAAGYDSLPKIMAMTESQVRNVPGFGPEKAKSLYEGLLRNKQLIRDLQTNGVKIKARVFGSLTGKTFCFSGTMKRKRAELESLVEEKGGQLKSVGKTLDYLVIDDPASTSSKAQAARKFNVKLISEDEFVKMAD